MLAVCPLWSAGSQILSLQLQISQKPGPLSCELHNLGHAGRYKGNHRMKSRGSIVARVVDKFKCGLSVLKTLCRSGYYHFSAISFVSRRARMLSETHDGSLLQCVDMRRFPNQPAHEARILKSKWPEILVVNTKPVSIFADH